MFSECNNAFTAKSGTYKTHSEIQLADADGQMRKSQRNEDDGSKDDVGSLKMAPSFGSRTKAQRSKRRSLNRIGLEMRVEGRK